MSQPVRPDGPLQPSLRLTVAVTGHRNLEPAEADWARSEALRVFTRLAGGVHQTSVLSQLAAGADQVFAKAALAAGADLEAMLPFALQAYRWSLPEEARSSLQHLAARARSCWTAPEMGQGAEQAYHLTGMVMLAQSDMLLALWDGEPSRGPGGTAAVIAQATRQGIPVVHIDPAARPTRVLWSEFDHLGPERLDIADAPSRPCDDKTLDGLAAAVLGPPEEPNQRQALDIFLSERERRIRVRLEYPLLLAATGIRRISRAHLVVEPYQDKTRAEWSSFHSALTALDIDTQALFTNVQHAFAWSDRLADHYAQVYRGGVILNYAAASAAVLVALVGVPLPHAKPVLLTLELLCLAALISNTAIGNRQQWHRRWLDYRYLAEQLRTMRSLKLVGAFGPRLGASAQASTRWTDWYAAAIWRGIGLPPSLQRSADVVALAQEIATHELEPQILYHEATAHCMHQLDHRLHQAGTALFVASLLVGLAGLFGYLVHAEAVMAMGGYLTLLGAALPTVGAALFGIRGQSDFAGAARRSEETAQRLRRTAERMTGEPMSLSIAGRLTEDAAQTMAADLGQWRITFLDRRLAIPA